MSFKLVKGDVNKLKGEVIVFSKYTGPYQKLDFEFDSSNSEIRKMFSQEIDRNYSVAQYATINQSNVLTQVVKHNNTMIENSFNETSKKLELLYKLMGLKTKKSVDFFRSTYYIRSNVDMFKYDEDLLYMGGFSNLLSCEQVLEAGVIYYKALYQDNLVKFENKKKKEECAFHDIFYGKDLSDYLMVEYIDPMIRNLKNNDNVKYSIIKHDFLCDTKDTYLVPAGAIFNFFNLIEKNNGNITRSLLETYTNYLASIIEEDFRKTSTLKKELEKMASSHQI